jgi:hypothetical protein
MSPDQQQPASVPNPGRRSMRPVEVITDRAKRYRANANPPPGRRACNFCASRKNVDIDHVGGDESDDAPENLIFLCRQCNTRKGITQAREGIGRRTAQYNPATQPTLKQFVDAIQVLRGDKPGNARRAGEVIRGTDDLHRGRYREMIAKARNPKPETPTYQQYAYAMTIHTRGSHDEGGKIIHATPPAKRSEYARQIAAGKRRKQRFGI